MRRFHFKLESLLMLRGWEEQKARAALSAANAQLAQGERRVASIRLQTESVYESWDDSSGRRFSTMDRLGVSSAVEKLQEQEKLAEQEKAHAEQRRQEAMSALASASMRRGVLSNLKEKRLRDHAADLLRQDEIEIEDAYNARRRSR